MAFVEEQLLRISADLEPGPAQREVLRSLSSRLEDADIAEAIMQLNTKELAYQAALSSSAKVMQLSLTDYI